MNKSIEQGRPSDVHATWAMEDVHGEKSQPRREKVGLALDDEEHLEEAHMCRQKRVTKKN